MRIDIISKWTSNVSVSCRRTCHKWATNESYAGKSGRTKGRYKDRSAIKPDLRTSGVHIERETARERCSVCYATRSVSVLSSRALRTTGDVNFAWSMHDGTYRQFFLELGLLRRSVLPMRQQYHHLILILLPWFRVRFGGSGHSLRRHRRRRWRWRRRRRGGGTTRRGILRVRDVVHVIAAAVRHVVRVVHLDREYDVISFSSLYVIDRTNDFNSELNAILLYRNI